MMDDLISRQAAIDQCMRVEAYTGYDAACLIVQLPSAQPEIIHCNACKHWKQTCGEMKGFGLGKCDNFGIKMVTCDGFCYWAERKEDERY